MRIAFAGDRDVSVRILEFLLNQGVKPTALMLSSENKASHADELIGLCSFIKPDFVFRGTEFRELQAIEKLGQLELDYIIGIHFPYIIPKALLEIPRHGFLNLHPAYLPYNRGWHTPTWAILEQTPFGATLHFMDEGIDTGDIVFQRQLKVEPGDTADTLYQRVKELEVEMFTEFWPTIVAHSYQRIQQDASAGTTHKRKELFTAEVQRIDLEETLKAGDLLRRLRGLTTNSIDEAAYYELDGKRYRIQVNIYEETGQDS